MKVGDLVTHPFEKGVGVILARSINNIDCLVHFCDRGTKWYRKDYLTLIKTS